MRIVSSMRYLKSVLIIFFALFFIVYSLYGGRFTRTCPYIEKTDISKFLAPVLHPPNLTMPQCPLITNVTSEPFDSNFINRTYNLTNISHGGWWKPSHCISQHKIAVIVPYRNREDHLKVFLPYIHRFLQAQLIDYQMYVVEQSRKLPFNRALLFNIGYTEVTRRKQVPCFIFHDVDLLPENTENVYGCTIEPRHMASSVSSLGYQLPYDTLFGGAVSFLQVQFQAINGFSNRYFGWGREDDDLYLRTINRGMRIVRFEPNVSRYFMLPHVEEAALAPGNLYLLYSAIRNQDLDGLNTVGSAYRLLEIHQEPLYTRFKVELLSSPHLPSSSVR